MSMPVIKASKNSAPHPPLLLKNTREASFSSYLDASEESFVRIHDDKEIDVFDAQKYFNDALNCSPKILPPHHRTPIKKPALSISSELSWNSRRGLLRRNQQLKKATKKSFLATIGCNCTCADRNSVDIDDDHICENRVGRLSFPIFGGKNQEKKEDAEKQRVISSPANNMVSWDAIDELKIPCISVEDSDSDASSDLFEIESLCKDKPSEASVEWSVITGSTVDLEEVSSTKKVVELKDMLSGCKTHKTVSVAGDAGARRHVTPLTRFHDESNARIISHPRSAPATAAHLFYTL